MDYALEPMNFTAALDYISQKRGVGASLNTEGWSHVPVAIRTRSTFSATLEPARVAQTMQDYFHEFLAGKKAINDNGEEYYVRQGRVEFVSQMRQIMLKEGLGELLPDGTINPEINENNIRDLRSVSRLQLIWDTNIEAAKGYGQFKEGQDHVILDVYPCQRFVRVLSVVTPRPYHESALDTVKRKDNLAFWTSLNRDFGVPWSPWGFRSGCDVEDVDRDEAEELGIIKKNEKVRPIEKEFNDQLEASVKGLDEQKKTWLKQVLGNQVKLDDEKAVFVEKPKAQPVKRTPKTQAQRTEQIERIAEKVESRREANLKKMKGTFFLSEQDQIEYNHKLQKRIYRDNMRYLGTQGMIIPREKRGTITTRMLSFKGNSFYVPTRNLKLSPTVEEGLELVNALVAKHKLPKDLGVSISQDVKTRAFHFRGNIRVKKSDSAAIVAHEIAHAIEFNHEDILKKSARFLHRRGGAERKVSLLKLNPYSSYRRDEYVLKDEFAQRGGSHYVGKLYMREYSHGMKIDDFVNSTRSTEILAMGIQRMIESPVEFKRNDPDYFNFVKSQIK
ncbi:MAG: hypothetical protein RR808_04730 [Akkermansia sp.]